MTQTRAATEVTTRICAGSSFNVLACASRTGLDVSDVSATGRPTVCAPEGPVLRLGSQLFPDLGYSAVRHSVSSTQDSSAAMAEAT